ncbi:MAG: hypothetical protein HOE90_24350 [Bacteriovoracaceae bacterium]|jgi:hypothetical protein|nr:hypothetical protein [Bacteriovoracaceae bacterium]
MKLSWHAPTGVVIFSKLDIGAYIKAEMFKRLESFIDKAILLELFTVVVISFMERWFYWFWGFRFFDFFVSFMKEVYCF